MEPGGSNGQDNPEDHEAKKTQIQAIIGTKIRQHLTAQVPDSLTMEYKARDSNNDSLEEFWIPKDMHSEEY